MKLVSAVVGSVLAVQSAAQTNPINKVLQLLSDLQGKVIKEGEGAQKLYAEFSEWCEDRSSNLGFEIKTGKGEVAELQAAIDQGASNIGSAQAKIEKLAGDLSVDDADLKAATQIRSQEATAFAAEEKELVEVISTLQRAIGILEREMRKGGASMAQLKNAGTLTQTLTVLVQGSMISTSDADRLTSLVQQAHSSDDDDDEAPGAPAAAVYKGHSSNIIDTLSDLLDKAQDQLAASRKKETNDKHAFEMLRQSLNDEIKFGEKELKETKAAMAAAAERKAGAEGDLLVTSKELKSDTETLSTLKHDCMTKAEDFQAETKSRAEELKALAEAKQVIKENTGGAEDLSYGLNQVSFLELSTASSITTSSALAQFEAARYIRDLARKEHSTALSQLASRVSSVIRASSNAGDDPLAKVKGMIQDMVERLERDAGKDATQKAFCDKELAETKEKKDDKTQEIQKLSTSIDRMAARSAQLKEETASLSKALAQLASSQAEMGKLRSEEKATFVQSKADMEQGLEGVKMALKILNEYYSQDDKAHASAEGAGTSIIGLLEVVESDFTKGLGELSATEENSQSTYDQQTKENSIERATKDQDVKYKTKEAAQLDQDASEASSDRAGVKAELDAVLEYSKKIDQQCIAKAETFEHRKARFEAELAGLREALRILEDEVALVQSGAKSNHGFLGRVRRHVA